MSPARAAPKAGSTSGKPWPWRAPWPFQLVIALVTGILLYWAFHHAPLAAIGETLSRFTAWQILVIVALNVAFHILVGLRWWFVARVDLPRVPIWELMLVRLAAFGLSYFTPGPQVGGEPVQVLYLRQRCRATFARATATVVMDKLIELLAAFLLLVVCVAVLLRQVHPTGILPHTAAFAVGLTLLLAWPLAHVGLLWTGRRPVSAVLAMMQPPALLRKAFRLTRAAEHLAGRFCRRKPAALASGVAISLLSGMLAVMEYSLITSYLGIRLAPTEMIAGWTAGWISFLFPLPGGLGALEASQVAALGAAGVSTASALGVALILRSRDLLFGGAGLVFAARHLNGIISGANRGSR